MTEPAEQPAAETAMKIQEKYVNTPQHQALFHSHALQAVELKEESAHPHAYGAIGTYQDVLPQPLTLLVHLL